MPASNTHDCFREFIGQRLIGLLFSALPLENGSLASGNRTLIFEDGRGLTLSDNGSYWIDSVENVQRAVERKRRELETNERELREVIAASGTLPANTHSESRDA